MKRTSLCRQLNTTNIEIERERQRDTERNTQRETHRERHRERETERETQRETVSSISGAGKTGQLHVKE